MVIMILILIVYSHYGDIVDCNCGRSDDDGDVDRGDGVCSGDGHGIVVFIKCRLWWYC